MLPAFFANSVANTMRPALQIIKMQPGFKNVSSVFFMTATTSDVPTSTARISMRRLSTMLIA